MDMKDYAQKAEELKQSGGYNCCQAVTAALADQTELPPEILYQTAAGFCIGMGNLNATCGALIGAGMIAGLVTEGKGTVRAAKQISETFSQLCGGAITCRELKGIDSGKVLCPCNECVKNAVLAYGKVLELKK